MDEGLPGDWFGTDEADVDDFVGPLYTRKSKRAAGTSDRNLRSMRGE